jgi:hypothetical protein
MISHAKNATVRSAATIVITRAVFAMVAGSYQ